MSPHLVDTLSIPPSATVRDALQAIDDGACGIAIVTDAGGRLVGVVTDGDIRRALLTGGGLEQSVSAVMCRTPVTAPVGTGLDALRELARRHDLNQFPVVDPDGRTVDIVLTRELGAIPLSSPDITAAEIEAVVEVLSTPHLSLGPKLGQFEERFAAYVGSRHAVAVNSGTSGLHLCVRGMGIGDGDEVITTPFSFVASANCVLFERARPVFVDIEPTTLNIDPGLIEAAITPRTKAILPVHVFGHPCDMEAIADIAQRHSLRIIEDACEAIGARIGGRNVGTYGDAAVFAFYPNKQMTTGEGGMIVTDDDEQAALYRSLRNQGRGASGGWLAHERLGYNYRLSDILCALGIAQVTRIEHIIERRAAVAALYHKRLAGIPGLVLPTVQPGYRMSWFVYVVRLSDDHTQADRDRILQALRDHDIGASNYFAPIHLQPFYREQFGYAEGDFPITEAVGQRTLALPFFNHLSEQQVDEVGSLLERLLGARA